MLALVALLILLPFSSSYILIESRNANTVPNEIASLVSGEHCQFYAALNTHFKCDLKSHLIQYSLKYCQRLVQTRNSFVNTQYQDGFRQCLQQKLMDKLQLLNGQPITCASFKQMDLDSHGNCLAASFKTLPGKDIQQFITTFQDTTTNYAQLCKLANSVAGQWSQLVNGDLMQFVKKQLKSTFAEGDLNSCTIKEKDILEEIDEFVGQVGKVLDKVKEVKEDVSLVIEKAKAVRDDFKTIRETIKGMESGAIESKDGLREILAKGKNIAANSKMIIDTIKNLGKDKKSSGTEAGQTKKPAIEVGLNESEQEKLALAQIAQIIAQFDAMKDNIFNVRDSVYSIMEIIDDMREGKKDMKDGLMALREQIEEGVENIYSIIDTAHVLKNTVFGLVESLGGTVEEVVDELIDGGQEVIDETLGEVTGGIGGALGSIGKSSF